MGLTIVNGVRIVLFGANTAAGTAVLGAGGLLGSLALYGAYKLISK